MSYFPSRLPTNASVFGLDARYSLGLLGDDDTGGLVMVVLAHVERMHLVNDYLKHSANFVRNHGCWTINSAPLKGLPR